MGLFGALLGGVVGGAIDGAIGDDPIGEGVVFGAIAGSIMENSSERTEEGYSAEEAQILLKEEYNKGKISTQEYVDDLRKLRLNPNGRFKITK